LAIVIAGVAPSAPRSCSSASAFARYCAFVDQRRAATGHLNGEVEQLLRLPFDRRGIGRRAGRTDPVVEMQVEEDRRRSCRAHLRRHHRAGGDG
jgi:hypothetical protein